MGGGPTPAQKAYGAMRRAVGTGGSAPNDRGIDGLWRRSRAKGLAAAGSASVRAALQAWPMFATDALPYYERVLGISPAPGATEAERRAIVGPLWTKRLRADLPSIDEAVKAIDPRASVFDVAHDYATTTQFGRAFATYTDAENPVFGGAKHTRYPNYSTDFRVVIQFQLGYAGMPNAADQRVLLLIRDVLLDILPSWVTFTIFTAIGFTLDEDPLDLTVFGS